MTQVFYSYVKNGRAVDCQVQYCESTLMLIYHRVQNVSGAHPASYRMGTRCSFPGGKAAGAWSWPLTFI